VYIHVITSFMYCFLILNILWHALAEIVMSQHRLVQFALFYPWPSTTSYIEYLINEIFNNSLKYYVYAWHSNLTTTSFIGAFWCNFLRNHAGAYVLGHPVFKFSNIRISQLRTLLTAIIYTQLYSPFEKAAQLYAKNESENLTNNIHCVSKNLTATINMI